MKELIVKNYPKSSVTEAIKTIKTNLRFSSINEKIKTVLVTSSISGEGKSFVSANLASAFAGSNDKVLLIDCDLRRGRQEKLFEITTDNKLGLTNLLIDNNWEVSLDDYINKTTVKNLDILTTGAIPPNPTTLLESKKIEVVMEELKKKYDYIILDTPPVIGITDTLLLSRLADTVLIVARAKKTPKDLLENTKEALNNVNAKIAGVILNGIDISENKYYKNYTYYKD